MKQLLYTIENKKGALKSFLVPKKVGHICFKTKKFSPLEQELTVLEERLEEEAVYREALRHESVLYQELDYSSAPNFKKYPQGFFSAPVRQFFMSAAYICAFLTNNAYLGRVLGYSYQATMGTHPEDFVDEPTFGYFTFWVDF